MRKLLAAAFLLVSIAALGALLDATNDVDDSDVVMSEVPLVAAAGMQ